jgi:DNA-directed RNA polymerase sigma subunit (sigma70/sigma32)
MAAKKPRTEAALTKRDRAKQRLDEATAELHEAIVDDLDDNHTKVELAALMGVSRERIRLIENAVRDRRKTEGR